MLNQDVSFFDLEGRSAGTMTSRLSTDTQRLQDLISANFGLILIVIVNLFGSRTLALAYGWRLALVAIFGCLPPLFFAAFTRMLYRIGLYELYSDLGMHFKDEKRTSF
jgi:ATP-binding cassette subfamily B (MDR/TAP) protein 1